MTHPEQAKPRPVLVLVDGSEGSSRAARFGARLAGRAGTGLVVLAPFQRPAVPQPFPVTHAMAIRLREEARRETREAAEQALRAVREQVVDRAAGEFRVVEIERRMADEVMELVSEDRVLALVVPRSGLGSLMPWRLDESDEIVERSPVPVILVA